MIASLPMYDRPETAAANDRLWSALRARLGFGPDALVRDGAVWAQWQSPDLLLSQTCGYPYRAKLHGQVTLIGAADHRLAGCAPGYYNSVLIARRSAPLSAFDGARFAYNEALSQSGWAAPMVHARTAGVTFGALVKTGAHRESARIVAQGHADLAALDALSWRMIRRWDGFASDLVEIERTAPTPALPYITGSAYQAKVLFSALQGAIADLCPADRDRLSLYDLVRLDPDAYLSVPTPPPPA